MYTDPILMKDLADLRMKDFLDEAEHHRKYQQLAGSEDGLLKSISAALSGWMQRRPTLEPQAISRITGEVKRATGEIPSV
jgi:hypothetical protein